MSFVTGGNTGNIRPYWFSFIIAGLMYKVVHSFTIAGGANAFVQMKTGNDLVHAAQRYMTFENGGPIQVDLLEAPTLTNGTTAPAVHANLDRRASALVSPVSVFVNPTGVTGGTIIDRDLIISGGQATQRADSFLTPPVFEHVYKPNTDYVFKITNQHSSTSSTFSIAMLYYLSSN